MDVGRKGERTQADGIIYLTDCRAILERQQTGDSLVMSKAIRAKLF